MKNVKRILLSIATLSTLVSGAAVAGSFEYNASPGVGNQSFATRYPSYFSTYNCTSCHLNGSPPALHVYGAAYKTAAVALGGRSQANVGPALANIESGDADGDTFTNIEEINTNKAAHDSGSIPTITVTNATTQAAKSGAPGATVSYTVNVNNTSSVVAEIFDVFVSVGSGQSWITSSPTSATPSIAPSGTSAVTVNVAIAGGATNGQTSTASFQVRSRRNTGVLSTILSLTTTATVAADTTPNAFSFTPLVNQRLSQVRDSAAATISGINAATSVSITGGSYSVGCTGTFITGASTITNGQTLCLRHTTAALAGVTTTTTVTVGGVQGTFSTTTGPEIVRGDANGDRKADLFWRDNSGGLAWWLMDSNTITNTFFGIVGNEWVVADVGEMDFDGRANIVWRRNTDGAAYLWSLNGVTPQTFTSLGIIGLEWTLVGTANFFGLDGFGGYRSDILWRRNDGTIYIWQMNGGAIASQAVIGNPGSEWVVAEVGDMNGDGKDDIVFRRNSDGAMYVWFMNGLAIQSAVPLTNPVSATTWPVVRMGDFNGDGKSDFVWRDINGDTWIWFMNGSTIASAMQVGNPGPAWNIHAIGDFNGDGKSDLVWRHTDGSIYLWIMNGAAVTSYLPIGNPGGTWGIVGP
jgi:FG-GAP-like repeat